MCRLYYLLPGTTWGHNRCTNTQYKAIHTLRIASKFHFKANYHIDQSQS